GVVVEHLLEVGYQPVGVDRVAVEAAADLVVHAAVGHVLAGEEDRVEERLAAGGALLAEEQLEDGGVRELGGAPEAAVVEVDVGQERLGRPPGEGGGEG